MIEQMKFQLKSTNQKLKIVDQEKKKLKTIVNTLKLSIPVIIERLNLGENNKDININSNLANVYEENGHTIHNHAVSRFLYKLEKKTN